jgi:hypothetical protein
VLQFTSAAAITASASITSGSLNNLSFVMTTLPFWTGARMALRADCAWSGVVGIDRRNLQARASSRCRARRMTIASLAAAKVASSRSW